MVRHQVKYQIILYFFLSYHTITYHIMMWHISVNVTLHRNTIIWHCGITPNYVIGYAKCLNISRTNKVG